jgi:hypothetical protein
MSFRECCDAITAGTGQPGGGGVESEQVREGTRDGVTIDVRPFSHHSFFLD